MKILRIPLVIVLVVAGRVFHADAQTVMNLHSFGHSTDGAYPSAGLVQGSDGNFYGTTGYGGTNTGCSFGCGTVFRISASGTYTSLYSFGSSANDGYNPVAGLVQGSDGYFYGTTQQGGTNGNKGTVFRISPSGTYTSLYSFAGYPTDGFGPSAGLVQGSDGNFYGTTGAGGTNDDGTVFRISPSGTETNLHSFVGSPADGADPYGGLVQGSDGYFYGTTGAGGTSTNYNHGFIGYGTVFRISPNGTYTSLYSFGSSANDGYTPVAGLVQGSDGNFYGTTRYGGTYNTGTVFRISSSGNYTNLYSFGSSPTDGQYPFAGVVQGSDGNLYGTTAFGGTNNVGTMFRISSSGNYTNLYSFGSSPNDGVSPLAGLVQGSDGYFYGTTSAYGNGDGTVFKLTVPLNPPANQISEIQFFSVFDSTYAAFLIPSVAGETYQLQYTDSMNPADWIDSGDLIKSIGGPLTTLDLVEPMTPQRFYRFAITP